MRLYVAVVCGCEPWSGRLLGLLSSGFAAQMPSAGDPIHQGLVKLSDEGRIVLPAYHVPVRSLPCAGVAGWSDFVLAGWCSWMIGVWLRVACLMLAWVRTRATVEGRRAAVSMVRSCGLEMRSGASDCAAVGRG